LKHRSKAPKLESPIEPESNTGQIVPKHLKTDNV
jgi:hypothetical protein